MKKQLKWTNQTKRKGRANKKGQGIMAEISEVTDKEKRKRRWQIKELRRDGTWQIVSL